MLTPAQCKAFDLVPDGILLVDASGAIGYSNSGITRLLGYRSDELVGRPVEMLLPERVRDRHHEHRARYAAAPSIRPMGGTGQEFIARRSDGTELAVDIQLAPTEIDGVSWTVAAVRDATQRHAFQNELREARRLAETVARLKGEFLGMAAHDLSQPLQTLELLVGSMERRGSSTAESGELFQEADACVRRMRQLLVMLGDIARADSGSLKVHLEQVQIAAVFSDLERQFAASARAKSLRYLNEPCSHIVETDPVLLRGMLSNLVSNAIRYTPRGEVKVRCLTPGSGGLELLVSDTGIGIPQTEMRQIFEDFHRAETARKVDHEGFGLGLGIVRRLSTLLELPVSVQSREGAGTTFSINVPPAKVHLSGLGSAASG